MPSDIHPPTEIERKFLVSGDAWRASATGPQKVRQGYLESADKLTIRVRIADDRAFLTLKSGDMGAARLEFEYAIPKPHAQLLLDRFCRQPLIEKMRFGVAWRGRDWSVDVFEGAHQGLVLAEIELSRIDEEIDIPPWAGQEVTSDPAYRNSNL